MHPEIRLSWQNTDTVEEQLGSNIPVAIGRSLDRMPSEIEGQALNHIVLPSSSVSGFHALIEWDGTRWVLSDRSKNGVRVNNKRVDATCFLNNGDSIGIDTYELRVSLSQPANVDVTQTIIEEDDDQATATIHFDDTDLADTDVTDNSFAQIPVVSSQQSFLQQFESF